MNTEMNNKAIQSFEVTLADGNTYRFGVAQGAWPIFGNCEDAIGLIELSATHHGDHDEFWVVVRDESANEASRFNCRNQVTGIIWAPE